MCYVARIDCRYSCCLNGMDIISICSDLEKAKLIITEYIKQKKIDTNNENLIEYYIKETKLNSLISEPEYENITLSKM